MEKYGYPMPECVMIPNLKIKIKLHIRFLLGIQKYLQLFIDFSVD